MNLYVFDIPEETIELAAWLETHLVGPELGELVAELAAIHDVAISDSVGPASRDRPDEGALQKSLGRELPSILRDGLRNTPRSQLQTLLRNPRLLLDLQERILINGGEYWQGKSSAESPSAATLEKIWSDLEPALAVPLVAPAAKGLKWTVRILMVIAASVMGVATGLHFSRPHARVEPTPSPTVIPVAQTGWGWNKPDAFPQNLDPKSYLSFLADGAEEWFKKRPENREDLEKRLTQFRKGCDTLINAEHQPLDPADRAWLKERCTVWSEKLDKHLADLRSGKDVLKVREEADGTVQKLVTALKSRLS